MQMIEQHEAVDVGRVEQLYAEALQLREQAQGVAESNKEDLIAQAYSNLLAVVDKLALQASASAALGDKLIGLLGSADLTPAQTQEFGWLKGMHYMLIAMGKDTRQFAMRYNKRAQRRHLEETGIDPSNKAAAAQHFDTIARMFFEPPNGCN